MGHAQSDRRIRRGTAIVAALVLVPAALAGGGHPGNRIDGTIYPDTLSGTSAADYILGGNGKDELYGGRGNDELDGGQGADWLFGGDGNDLMWGGQPRHWDYLRRERLIGGAGDDILTTVMAGAVVTGGPGSDELHPDGRDCTANLSIGTSRKLADYARCVNYTLGNQGNDRVWARDGASDWISCGPGIDRVYAADRIDYIASDCERASR